MSKWNYVNSFDEYYDFEKELLSIPDEGSTTVDMRLTFNVETHACYYHIMLRNDDGNSRDWETEHKLPWAVGIALLGSDITLPEGLT